MKTVSHSSEFMVRDYECDMQGVVNNSVYQNYLEHARHLLLKSTGLDFSVLNEEGILLTVIRVELDYKAPLVSGDRFRIDTVMERVSPLRFLFRQEIRKEPGDHLVLTGHVYGTAINSRRRPVVPVVIEDLFRE